MLVKDEALQAREAAAAAREAYAERVNAYTREVLERATVMEDRDLRPNNLERQRGSWMTPQAFETGVVARLGVPNLIFRTHPTNPSKRIMYQQRGADLHQVCVYENTFLPEYSVRYGIERWVPDPGVTVAQRADLPADATPLSMSRAEEVLKARGVRGLRSEIAARAADAAPSRLGMKRIVEPGGEAIRGWRTVLAYMVQHGLVSPDLIESVVPAGQRASWAGHMGRAPLAVHA